MQEFPPSFAAQPIRKKRLQLVIHHLARDIGPRNIYHYSSLCRAADYMDASFREAGYVAARQAFEADGKCFSNVSGELRGAKAPEDIFVVGAHYDTHKDSPGANDNGSGVAIMLELARAATEWNWPRTIRFVAFTNEENPFTRTAHMGSHVYAAACRERGERVIGMLCLETLGCYSQEVGSQWLSLRGLLLPRRGNFLALVANPASGPLLDSCSAGLRVEPGVRFRTLKLPGQLPGVRSSDHWSFWKNGYQAVMATDTAPLRYKHYHRSSDTLDKINFDWLESVADGLLQAVRHAVECAA